MSSDQALHLTDWMESKLKIPIIIPCVLSDYESLLFCSVCVPSLEAKVYPPHLSARHPHATPLIILQGATCTLYCSLPSGHAPVQGCGWHLLPAGCAERAQGIPRRQQDVLSSLAFLTTGSVANSGSVVAAGGMAALVPLLGKRCERTVIGAVRVISNILRSPAGQVSLFVHVI